MAQSEFSIIRSSCLGWCGTPGWEYNLPMRKSAMERQIKSYLKTHSKEWVDCFDILPREEFVKSVLDMWYNNVPKWLVNNKLTYTYDIVLSYIEKDLNWALSFMEEPKLFHIIEDRGYGISYIHKTFTSENKADKWLVNNTVKYHSLCVIDDGEHVDGNGAYWHYYIQYEF